MTDTTKPQTDEEMFERWRAEYNAQPCYTSGELAIRERCSSSVHAVPFFAALAIERARVAEIADRIEARLEGHIWNASDESDDALIESIHELLKELRRG